MSLKMDNILDDHPDSFVLPPAAAVEFTAASFVFLNAYASLAATYNAHGDMLFNLIDGGGKLPFLRPRQSFFNRF